MVGVVSSSGYQSLFRRVRIAESLSPGFFYVAYFVSMFRYMIFTGEENSENCLPLLEFGVIHFFLFVY